MPLGFLPAYEKKLSYVSNNEFYRPVILPVTQPTMSIVKALKETAAPV